MPFSRGGPHTPSNLACLCSAHHRNLHDGHLSIRGDAETRLRFEFPNGRVTHVGREKGLINATSLEGGIGAWTDAGGDLGKL